MRASQTIKSARIILRDAAQIVKQPRKIGARSRRGQPIGLGPVCAGFQQPEIAGVALPLDLAHGALGGSGQTWVSSSMLSLALR